MDAIQPWYVSCRKGVFTLPERLFRELSSRVEKGSFYLRHDEDGLTISTTRLADGYRRALNARFRSAPFRNVTRLAIVNLQESIRVMPVESR